MALAIRPEAVSQVQFSEPAQEIGFCHASGRRILLFSGTATLDDGGTRLRWRTGADRDVDARPILVGDLVPNVRETVYRGVPRLWIERDGHVIAPRAASLRWRPKGGGTWRHLQDASPRGAVDFAVVQDGELEHSISAHVVSAELRFEFDRSRRELRIFGLDAPMVGAFGARPLTVRREGSDLVVELGPPSGTPLVAVRGRWEREITLTLSDPSYELRLIDERDRLVNTRAVFALDGLSGKRILANREVLLCMELRALDAPRLAISRPVTGDVPLSALRDTIRNLLGSSSRLDSSVVVSALGESEHIAEVRRYAREVDPFAEVRRDGPFAALAAATALDLRAVSLTNPGAGAQSVSAPAPESHMRRQLEPALPAGPWLLFGTDHSGAIIRPRVLRATNVPVEPMTALIRAIATDSAPARERAFDLAFAIPAELVPEDARRLIDLAQLARRERLPASGIDALRALGRSPALAVHLLAACDDLEERAALLDLQRDIPFLWCATSIATWIDAFLVRYEKIRATLAEAGVNLRIGSLASHALAEIATARPELTGHTRAVFLSMIASSGSADETIGERGDVFSKGWLMTNARTEIDRLITRHQEGDAPPRISFSRETMDAARAHWSHYAEPFAELIAAPFAVAEHAAGMRSLTPAELDRCRDAALYDPEFFEVIVPMRTNELLTLMAMSGGEAR
jgi:hypothetical protein